jgi:hypothetical protein
MKGFWRRLVSTLVFACCAWITVLGCAHDDSTLFVYNVVAGSISGTSCTFSPNPSGQFFPKGILDVGLVDSYEATFLLANQLVSQANPSTPQTESAFITIDHVNVKVTQTDGTLINQYSTVTSSTINPATGTTPGFALANALILDPVTVGLIEANAATINRVETFVQFFGKTTGGTAVESNTFEFAIDICQGCLVRFSVATNKTGADAIGPFPQPNCLNVGAATTSSIAVPCRPGQDDPIDCTQCVGNRCCQSAACCTSLAACR